MYADDLLLVSISIYEMQKMLDICNIELEWLNMKVNVKKSLCIRVGKRYNVTTGKLSIDNTTLPWVAELRYLGLVFKAGSGVKCNFHNTKIKFFRSLNGILGKLGSTPPVNLTLSLVATFCNPVLLFGLESLVINKSDRKSLSYPYHAVFMKLFASFDNNVIEQCQYYCDRLPFQYELDLRVLNFYANLNIMDYNLPACALFRMFGRNEYLELLTKYDINEADSVCSYRSKIHTQFEECAKLYVM
jgi:hypothetical protein